MRPRWAKRYATLPAMSKDVYPLTLTFDLNFKACRCRVRLTFTVAYTEWSWGFKPLFNMRNIFQYNNYNPAACKVKSVFLLLRWINVCVLFIPRSVHYLSHMYQNAFSGWTHILTRWGACCAPQGKDKEQRGKKGTEEGGEGEGEGERREVRWKNECPLRHSAYIL